MSKLSRAALAALFLFWGLAVCEPAQAQAAVQPAAPLSLDQSLAFISQLGEVMEVQVAGAKKLLDAKPLLESMTSPAASKANAPRIRALLAEARAIVERADAMTGRIAVPAGLRLGTLDIPTMLSEVRSQNAKTLDLIRDYDSFVGAAERGDRAAAMKMAPRLMEGGFLIIDGNASIYRNRQAAIPSTQSVHQALEVGIQLYRAMSAAGRGWLAARQGIRPDAAAAALRAQLADISGRITGASKAGRANLERELSELDGKSAALGLRGEEAANFARLRQALAGKEKLFAVGDELSAIIASAGSITGRSLAAEASPRLMARLMPLEMHFQAALAHQAAIATGKAR
ncbi:MAG TPA: hypothetical protein VF619_10710 [Allosphingosinicella sp.]|jgi:hypothetical protein